MAQATSKITVAHLRRKAILYIRQSTMQQAREHTESTRQQYALKERLVALGWPEDRVDVIDSDLGLSGAEASRREGFKKMIADVGNAEVGAVASIECSRLSRKTQDWGHLLEICSITKTLVIDADGIYDPNDFNDAMLLGLKGTMSAAELHFLFARMRGGALSMAARGEYRVPLPLGYVYNESGSVVKEPNLEVQNAVKLFFETFRMCGSITRSVKYYRDHGLKFPKNPGNGFYNDEIEWNKLSLGRASAILKNPAYAGVYSYGKYQVERTVHGKHIRPMPQSEWHTRIEGHHEGYISMDEFKQNQMRVQENRKDDAGSGPAREGPALLQGIAICGKCGAKMRVGYNSQKTGLVPIYSCQHQKVTWGGEQCQHIHGVAVDQAISDIVLEKLTPTAILQAVQIQREIERRTTTSDNYYNMMVQRAQHDVDLARRRYNNVDPSNRLVAFELERLWNCSMLALTAAEEEKRRHETSKQSAVTNADIERLLGLPADVAALWNSNKTDIRNKKRLLRCIIEDVTLEKIDRIIKIGVRFKGGTSLAIECPNPIPVYERNVLPKSTLDIIEKESEAHDSNYIADVLNSKGLKTACGLDFTPLRVQKIMRLHGILSCTKRLQNKGYLTLPEKAETLGMSWRELYHRIRIGNYDGDYVQAGKNGNIMFPPEKMFKC